MDFSKLDYALECIALQHKLPAQEVLDRWLERQQASVPDRWRFLDGIPCIIGGLIALLGTLEGRGGNFPWKTLPTVLARRGCILQNYPENILMPGEKRPTLAKSKGISDLSLDEWRVLADALKRDITCASRHAIEAVEEGVIEDEEAIIEDEVEVDHGDLIPQIACTSQHAIEAVEEGVFEDEEGIIKDKEEVDELLGSQEIFVDSNYNDSMRPLRPSQALHSTLADLCSILVHRKVVDTVTQL
ncbi:uncharacterized protein EDB91DRAFT_1257842 [Suillus paluster]|uniref:uncharacterized protein n=1 Tax=Suillus paluster TaxID=48578 RepID=UPI001B88388D|nr:uncharacterized protein EDB91DRAFT_1257842 [Suillus paluster]KAG1719197.1 hypothetical protein EDB91DRAFT_1257842 [Suillus paluster]